MDFSKFSKIRRLTIALSIVAFVAIGFVGFAALTAFGQNSPTPARTEQAQAGNSTVAQQVVDAVSPSVPASSYATINDLQNAFRAISKKVLPVVVEVNVVDIVQRQVPQFFSPFGNQGNNGQSGSLTQQGLGSGVIVRQTGDTVYVLTNNHVAGNASQISVKMYDGKTYAAKLVGADPNKDLALISFQSKQPVQVATLGDSNTLQVGDWVLAVGNPLGYESTVTQGIVSALGRQSQPQSGIADYTRYIQTDAAINEGNSGGPLVNIKGQVVGINTWIASPSGGNIGLGFSIPINTAKTDITDFINNGKVSYGWLGVSTGNPVGQAVQDMGLNGSSGGFVYGVLKGSPAAKAGILPGDFITSVGGQQLTSSSDLTQVIGNAKPGQKLSFSLIRDGKPMSVNVTIGTRPNQQTIDQQTGNEWPGMMVLDLNATLRQQLNIPQNAGNVVIGAVDNGSPAGTAGLRSGDIIKKINNKTINSVKDFYNAINSSRTNSYSFQIDRNGMQATIGVSK